ncbi:hypothetical protein AB434_3106 [Heyndrickxia coagulans]|jgi:hypothetical protein|uniref:Uncharacterized protein n=1 Tax=Heyndrickxia coagulans TaxID=1398 RepID=A0AAN0T5W9_HEYCO|nr:hypothetical protein SB48_HM08orf03457 [Heyndrickxia coagulans]AKN55511.1 hypothetical protein AB434_3106 [Heyndrickxia coagulans]KYC59947.1 hypothetical protein B4100_3393 [Heyndrickxia coagulans]KYC79200.1 hypothetical protein B4096_3267 [Heyndrickxia coagulans]
MILFANSSFRFSIDAHAAVNAASVEKENQPAYIFRIEKSCFKCAALV